MADINNDQSRWKALFFATVLASYFLVLMEWLFFATKPSFMSALDTRTSVEVLILGPLPLLVPAVTIVAVIFGLSRLIRNSSYRAGWLSAAILVPSAILTIAFLLLADNFTLTLFGFGVRSTGTFGRVVYLLLVAGSFAVIYSKILRSSKVSWQGIVACVLVCLSALAFFFQAPRTTFGEQTAAVGEKLPNILLLSTDGLDAEHMSLYGYHRETTPFLDGLSKRLLICENSFTNAGATGGSLVSVLTGRLPTQTKVIYPPDILRGEDVYRHLPLLLRQFGYHSIQLTMRHYADAYDSNMREAFDSANFREPGEYKSSRAIEAFLPQEIAYFWEQLWDRTQTRLLHLASRATIENVFETVTKAKGVYKHDVTSIQELFKFFEGTDEPVFAQIHLIGTHGSRFRPRNKLYSDGLEQTQQWMPDFYDDAIRDFDHYVRWVFAWLRNHKKLDDTLVVIYSDHGMKFTTHKRLPLLFGFPGKAHAGRISANVQNLDIAPTLLDFLGSEIPSWMTGRSLIAGDPDPLRPIISATRKTEVEVTDSGLWKISTVESGPPFFTLGRLQAVICSTGFSLDLVDNSLAVFAVEGHTSACAPDQIPSPREAEGLLLTHLEENGYELPVDRKPATVVMSQEIEAPTIDVTEEVPGTENGSPNTAAELP